MRRRRVSGPLLGAALGLLWGLPLGLGTVAGAQAAAPRLPVTAQAQRAQVIVRATLGTPQTVTQGEVRWRVYPLTVAEVVAGREDLLPRYADAPALFVWQEVGGLPQWRTGQEAFFLLYGGQLDSPLVGFDQGYYPVVGGRVTLPAGDPLLASLPGRDAGPVPAAAAVAAAPAAGGLLPQPVPALDTAPPPGSLTPPDPVAPPLPGTVDAPAGQGGAAASAAPGQGAVARANEDAAAPAQDAAQALAQASAGMSAQAPAAGDPERTVSADEFRDLLRQARGGRP